MVSEVEKTENTLKEARERINKLMKKSRSEGNFAERLEVAKSELNKETERAKKNNTRRYVQATVQHYCFVRGIDTPGSDLPITSL